MQGSQSPQPQAGPRPIRRPTSERGQVLPLMAIVIVVVVTVLSVAVRVSERLDAAARARTAADAAALAGAAAGEAEARAVAQANGGQIVEYRTIGQTVIVVVSVGPVRREATAEAVIRLEAPPVAG
jgi:Putative Flp pilus-assembly TadE/G-like